MAPLTRRRKKALATAAAAPVIDPADRLSALPNDVLPLILSFLPAQDAVRTCVLARTWRHVWKEFPKRLLITGTSAQPSVQEVRGFFDHLLRLRLREIEQTPLHTSEIRFRSFDHEDMPRVNRWIRCALECQIQVLQVDMCHEEVDPFYFWMSSEPLVS
ncbi:hypothetical protein BAE44_0022569 [Dichanthelium oligosanthes]|uniref:F-box domain-containing protein n=1 Tax=Dichanthelium oligosanthes TaxID=888268 RepID=A0A1E5UU08_9POAL|nr:hypothetical protein BAE44_0022569 [Dichanthelium oligosanthes]